MKPIAEWTDEELAAVILAQLWRYQDEAGQSHGRTIESAMLEAAQFLLDLIPLVSPEQFPVLMELLREADRRRLSRPIRTHEDPST